MDINSLLTGAEQSVGHGADLLTTDSSGHLISEAHIGPDGTGSFTDGQGMNAGTYHTDIHGVHFNDPAGHELTRVDSGTVYNESNLPMAQILQHGNVTDISDLSGKPIGHLVRTSDGVLTFDGGYPPHEIASTIPI